MTSSERTFPNRTHDGAQLATCVEAFLSDGGYAEDYGFSALALGLALYNGDADAIHAADSDLLGEYSCDEHDRRVLRAMGLEHLYPKADDDT